ncbi:MAG: type III pantothenate kinase [Cyclobacteriaceae bacterium]|nr:MAG: type III pantothenate kinase [Cyclobacteriaceae bacterium]
MRNMAIDMGNTRTKAGLFTGYQLESVLTNPEKNRLKGIVDENNIERVIVCSVATNLEVFEAETGLEQVTKLTSETAVPIKNLYGTPHTLGMDRLAAVIGAQHLYPNQNSLVIDAGTTITYDFISKDAEYFGGGISPGIDLRFKALNQHTFKLPRIHAVNTPVPLIGSDTKSSIQSGVINGVLAEIEGFIRSYEHKYPNLQVVMCGGDAGYFETMLKAPKIVVPHLVLIGLNSIIMYHAQN